MDAEEAEVAAWFEGRAERTIETSCARVFLAGDTAFKVKRRIDLGFLNYSTLELRCWALERELAFNRAAASDIYRAVRKVTRGASGALELDGGGAVVEYALEMRRFDADAVLSAQPWAVDGALADELGRTIAAFHAQAPLRPEGGGGKALKYTIDSNRHLLGQLTGRLGKERIERLLEATDAEYRRQEPLLDARAAAGFARQCHADLHLGNILLENGRPVLFDCIEFNDVLSDIDVQYDLAFLLMDLDFRRRRDAGVRVLSVYLDEAARHFPGAIWEGLAALPLMLSVRAAVRAHVWAHSADDAASIAYLDAAQAHLSPPPPRLVAVGGLSGTGKTSFARLIAPGVGASPGAVILRTDELRKRLMGRAAHERLPDEAYAAGFHQQVYAEMMRLAGVLLRAGQSVVLDATFLRHANLGEMEPRHMAEQAARDAGVPFSGVWLEAPAEVLAERIAGRSGDASDATLATLRKQIEQGVGDIAWTRIDASVPVEDSAQAWTVAQA